MTSPPDVQNVPDVWTLLQEAANQLRYTAFMHSETERLMTRLDAALAQRDRFVMVPKEPTREMYDAAWSAWGDTSFDDMRDKLSADHLRRLFYMFAYAMLVAAPNPTEKL